MTNKDFFAALADLEHERGIGQEIFIEALSNALASAYKKQMFGETGNVEVRLNPEKCTIRFFLQRTIVDDEVEELGDGQIYLKDALLIKKSAKVGDVLAEEFVPKDFSRIAAQTAKQVILQKIHETERDNTRMAATTRWMYVLLKSISTMKAATAISTQILKPAMTGK